MDTAKITFDQIPYVLADLVRQITLLREELKGAKENAIGDKYMNALEAATYLNMEKSTIYKKTSNKEIPFIKRGKNLYFSKIDLDNWLKEGKV